MSDKKRYSTDELVRLLEEFGNKPVPLFHAETDAIIGRLRRADKLCESAKVVSGSLEDPFPPEVVWVDERYQLGNILRKAVADYEED